MENENYKTEKKYSLKSKKCVLHHKSPCSKTLKSKIRYKRYELEEIYKECYPETKIYEIKKKNMKILCQQIMIHANVINEKCKKSQSNKDRLQYLQENSSKKSDKKDILKDLDDKLMNINFRKNFIDKIINGKILINNIKINYPYVEIDNNYSGKSILKQIPCNLFSAIKILKGEIQYLFSEKGVSGYPFKICLEGKCDDKIPKIGLKILPFVNNSHWVSYECIRENIETIKGNYGFKKKESTKKCIQIDKKRPENVEPHLLHLLSNLVTDKKTPHIVLPIMNFVCDIDNLLKGDNSEHSNIDWKKREMNYEIFNIANVLITEWADGGDLQHYILKKYIDWHNSIYCEIIWTTLLFQLIFTLCIIFEKYPNFRHNDLKVDNILVTITDLSPKSLKNYLYYIDGRYYSIPNIGFQIKLWDFDLSCIKGIIDNYKVEDLEEYGIRDTKNQYYDIHCFLNYLRIYTVNESKQKYIPKNIQNFWNRVIPRQYRHIEYLPNVYWSRVIPDIEFTTPSEILKSETYNTDGIFNKFLIDTKDISKIDFIDTYNIPPKNI